MSKPRKGRETFLYFRRKAMKRYTNLFLTAIMILTALAAVKAAAPANDNFAGAQSLGSEASGSAMSSNVDATQETDEPNHYIANANKHSVWFKWTAPASRSMAFEELDDNFSSVMAVYTSTVANPTFAQLTKIGDNADLSGYLYNGCRINFWAQSGKTYYIAVDWSTAAPGNQMGGFELKFHPNALPYSTKFDQRDHRASVMIFRPSGGVWYMLWSIYSISYENIYGQNGDTPVPADYNGDGRSDFAVVRNEGSRKVWYVSFQSTTQWGLATDQPLVGDFDNDGRADLTAVRNNGQNLIWYVRRSSDNAMAAFTWGAPGDKPVLGDFDGDGATDVAVTRNTPNGLVWYILRSGYNAQTPPYSQYSALQFGIGTDIATVEDYDGDGKSDVAVFRPSDATWYALRSTDDQVTVKQFGQSDDKPQPADYDNDGKADFAAFNPQTGMWNVLQSGNGQIKSRNWGVATDLPATSLTSLTQ
jgi:hypothetical protein